MDTPSTPDARFEARLRSIAADLAYPATPNLAALERQRLASAIRQPAAVPGRRPSRLALGLIALLVVVLAAMLVSPVRARVLEWIRIGAVRILVTPPTPTAPVPGASILPTPAVTPTLMESVLDLAGETSLADAQEKAGFTILLPGFPDDLGQPDYVYLQRMNNPVVILAWMDPDHPNEVLMSLSEASSSTLVFEKYEPKSVLDTTVNGEPAVWIDGNYVVVMRNGEYSMSRMIDQGHTLIWSSDGMTFRLETDADLETALRTAESLR